jgi:hypothetical protein
MDPDPDPGGPKTCGSGRSGFGYATLLITKLVENDVFATLNFESVLVNFIKPFRLFKIKFHHKIPKPKSPIRLVKVFPHNRTLNW